MKRDISMIQKCEQACYSKKYSCGIPLIGWHGNRDWALVSGLDRQIWNPSIKNKTVISKVFIFQPIFSGFKW